MLLRWPEVVESPRIRRAVSGSPVPLMPWKSGGRGRGQAKTKESLQILQTNLKRVSGGRHLRRGVGGVAKHAESSAIENIPECPPFIRGNSESSAKEGLGVPAPAFPHLQPTLAYGRDQEDGVCRSEVGGDALAKSQRGAVGLITGRVLRKGECRSGGQLPARQWCHLNIFSRLWNTRGRQAGFGRSRA